MADGLGAFASPRSGDTSSPLLEIRGLARRFGGLSVIGGLDLTVARGEILGVLGPNGAGKSTLFNMISGVLPPSAGSIVYGGRDVTRLRVWDRCRLGIARSYQVPKPFTHMSVFENVLVAAVHGGGMSLRRGRPAADSALVLTGLASRAAQPAGTLSLLDMKRLELAKALGQQPRLLLLDEIAGGLTDAECHLLLDIVQHVHQSGVTVVWVEHVIHALRRVATRLAVLYGGNILVEGDPEAILADARVRDVYLGE
jgi:branched-chain amino acid transport system ATP-binding protein